ncbi:MAG: prepilin-type N-terminal cleavage/methylation domain-containing protein [Colwellia sp.]|nr:prepilin-type N-terminal cleavage/methylation domain-containing protein [Colwellia sp.]
MFFLSQNFKQHSSQNGFTLMELLTVITLMAITATVAITSYDGVQDQSRYDVAKFEMTQIRKALIQFRQDSGTNSFPAQGSYDCTDDVNGGSITQPNSEFNFPAEAGITHTQKIAWCEHQANLWMLFTNPFDTTANPQKQWNPDTKRGWNGPYLQRKDGYLTLSDNTINLVDIPDAIWAIADPYVVNQQNTGVQWSIQTTSDVLNKAGTPYVLLVDITNTPSLYQPRLISAGEDGKFELNNNDVCITPVDTNGQALDQVLCLLN